MTGTVKQLIFSLLAWGLFVFLPNNAQAQSKLAADVLGAQVVRLGGQDFVDKMAENEGYTSDNIKALGEDDYREQAENINAKDFVGANLKGAGNAAAARWKGSDGLLSKIWNVTTGAALDVFRNDTQIANSLEKYRNEKTSDFIDRANAAASERESQMDSARVLAKAAAVYETPNGQKIYMDIHLKSIGGLMDGCIPLPLKLEQSRKCFLCPLFGILFGAVQSMSTNSYNTLAQGFMNLLLIGFALYVSYVTLKQVSSFTKQDAPKFISELLVISFKVMLAYLILKHIDQFYYLVLEPLLGAAMDFGAAFLFRSSSSGSDSAFMTCNSAKSLPEGVTVMAGFYSTALFAKISCFITAVQQELAVASSIGSSMMCVARNEGAGTFGFPDFTMMISGLIIWVFAWLVTLAFGFYLIDAVVRLGIVGGLLPFLIACWPFKMTSGYTKKGWNMFMNTFFTFVFLGLVVSVNIELGMQSMTGGEGGAEKIMDLVNKNEIKPLLDIMDIGLMGLLFMILCCLFGFKLCAEAVSLAGQMSESQQGNIGAQLGSLGAGAAKWGAKTAGKGALKAGKAVGKFALMATPAGRAVMAKKESIGKSLFQGASKAGDRIGLKGFGGGEGGSGIFGGGGGKGGGAQNSLGGHIQQAKNKPALGGTTGNNSATAQNSSPGAQAADNKAKPSTNQSDTQNKQQVEDKQNQQPSSSAGNNNNNNNNNNASSQSSRPAADNQAQNAANAEQSRTPDMSAQADQLVQSSKQRIAVAAQEAAAQLGAEGGNNGGSAANAQPSGKAQEDAESIQKMQAQVQSLQTQIANIENEKQSLQSKLGGGTAGGTQAADQERLKALEEKKNELQQQLNNITASQKK